MKILNKLLLLLTTCCWATFASAQCGADAQFQASLNPNGVPQFTDSSSVQSGWTITNYLWNFGDGSTSSLQNPTHVYAHPGNYTVCEYIRSEQTGTSNFCYDSVCHPFSTCAGMVHANISYQANGQTVVYVGTGTSNYPPLTYAWTFSGNATPSVSTTATTTVQYPGAGLYNACLTVSDANGCTETVCQNVPVTSTACSGIQASFSQTISANTVALSSTVQNPPSGTLYQWWMDGQAINNPNPNSAYTISNVAIGHHTFCLYVYANANTFCDSTCHTEYVPGTGPCGGAQADFNFTVSGNTIHTNAGTAYPTGTQFQWWLDGNPSTPSTGLNEFNWSNVSPGTHNVCLYIYGTNTTTFCDSICQTVAVTGGCNISAGFQYTSTSPGLVTFNANNYNGASYHWSFGDNTDATTPTFSVAHGYPQTPGTHTYQACLVVSIPGTNCADTFCQYVVVQIPTSCHASYVYATSAANYIAEFDATGSTAVSGDSITAYSWSFGDSTTGTGVNPHHTYNHPGLYAVCLYISTANGCTSVTCDSVQVGQNTPPCNALFSFTYINCHTIQFVNSSSGNYTNVTWSFGDGSSSTNLNPDHNYTTPGTYAVELIIYGANCQTSYTHTVTIQPCTTVYDTICGIVFNDYNSNGYLDSNETGIAGAAVTIGSATVYTDSNGYYHFVAPAGVYGVHATTTQGCVPTLPISANGTPVNNNIGYEIHGANGGTFCGYNFGVNCNIVHVCGVVYFDANNNGVRDSGEAGIPNVHVYITGSNGVVHNAYTNSNGEYCETVPAGTYTVHAASTSFQACTLAPTSLTVNATVAGQYYSGNNFGIYCQPGSCNLQVSVTPHTTVTPGHPAWYDIQVCNVGSGVSTGTVNMFYDPVLVFTSASPVQTSNNSSTHTLSFTLPTMVPGNCVSYWVNFNALQSVTVGQQVFTLVNVTTGNGCNDVDLTNNVDTIHQEATASWDPNNKLAYVTNYDNPAYQLVSSVNANQRIEYVINFQNTGTAPAVNVVVKDAITSDLDFSSFELLGSSHPCMVTANGTELNFKFSDIQLPAESADEQASHGFVKFAINAVNGLAPGHVISDEANIFFDYNSPVTTNDAAVILLEPNGVNDVAATTTVVVAPNPMSQYAQIRLNSNNVGFRFRVTDMTGRIVADEITSNNTMMFERNSLASGIYTYQVIQNNKAVVNGKLVIE